MEVTRVSKTNVAVDRRVVRALMLVDDRVPGYRGRLLLHPTWQIEYLPQN